MYARQNPASAELRRVSVTLTQHPKGHVSRQEAATTHLLCGTGSPASAAISGACETLRRWDRARGSGLPKGLSLSLKSQLSEPATGTHPLPTTTNSISSQEPASACSLSLPLDRLWDRSISTQHAHQLLLEGSVCKADDEMVSLENPNVFSVYVQATEATQAAHVGPARTAVVLSVR